MTKKDYQVLARALHEAYEATVGTSEHATHLRHYGVTEVREQLVRALQLDNPRFDPARFRDAATPSVHHLAELGHNAPRRLTIKEVS
jgi:hypothetical protein